MTQHKAQCIPAQMVNLKLTNLQSEFPINKKSKFRLKHAKKQLGDKLRDLLSSRNDMKKIYIVLD